MLAILYIRHVTQAIKSPRIIAIRFGGCLCLSPMGNILVPISHFDQKVDRPDIISSSSVSPEILGIALDKTNLFQISPVPCL